MADDRWWMDPRELEKLARWGVDEPPSEDEELKEALLRQQHKEHFEAPDPSDELSDEEIIESLPDLFRRSE